MKSTNPTPKQRVQSLGEEIANAITHGIGAALSIAGLTLLIVMALMRGDVVVDAFGELELRPASPIWVDATYRRCDLTPYPGVGPFVAEELYDILPLDDFDDFGLPPDGEGCGAPSL